MSEYLADTGDISRGYCPGCRPDADPTAEILRIVWCGEHAPSDRGGSDEVVTLPVVVGGMGEAEGETCRAFAEWQRSLR